MNNKHSSTAITRRYAVKIGTGAIAGAVIGNNSAYLISQEQEPKTMQDWINPYRDIRGFNYQPSYEATGYSIWRQFRPEKWSGRGAFAGDLRRPQRRPLVRHRSARP